MAIESILLVNAGNDASIRGSANAGSYPALGVLSIATYTMARHPELNFLAYDGQVYTQQTIEGIIRRDKPSVVGISVLGASYQNSLALARAAKEAGAVTVIGNDHATVNAEVILRKRPYVDYIVMADLGEPVFDALIEHLEGKIKRDSIPQLAYREDGKVCTNRERELPLITAANRYSALDQTPVPNASIYDNHHWETYLSRFQRRFSRMLKQASIEAKGIATIDIGRGCSRGKDRNREAGEDIDAISRCKYCGIADLELKFMSSDKSWEVIRALQKQTGANMFYITHDSLSSDRIFLRALADARPKYLDDVHCLAYTQARETNKQLIELYKRIGVMIADIGLDHGNDEMLKRLKGRNDSVEANRRAIQLLSEAGIWLHSSFVLGGPGETKKSLDDLMKFTDWALDNGLFASIEAAPLFPELNAPFGRLLTNPEAARQYAASHGIKIYDKALLEKMPKRLRETDYIDPDELCESWARIWTPVPYDELLKATAAIREKASQKGINTGGAIANRI